VKDLSSVDRSFSFCAYICFYILIYGIWNLFLLDLEIIMGEVLSRVLRTASGLALDSPLAP
jgi:hypothetical protein